MDSPLFRRAQKRGHGGAGRANEEAKAKRLKMRSTVASGALSEKGDMVNREFRVENKSTKNASLGLKKEWLTKIQHEAYTTNRIPALAISFTTESGLDSPADRWVMIPEWVFKDVLESWRTKD